MHFSVLFVWIQLLVLATCKRDDTKILSEFYNSCNGVAWINSSNWNNPTISPCEWFGITCNDDGDIVAINMFFNNLKGMIPTSFGDLTSLQNIDLSINALTGTIPPSFGQLTNLQSLRIGTNQFNNASIPAFLSVISLILSLFDQKMNYGLLRIYM